MALGSMSLTSWQMPPAEMTCTGDELDVWCASLDLPLEEVTRLTALLDPEERARARRYAFERDRRRFTVARAGLRSILGVYLKLPPSSFRFHYGPHGKPMLETIQHGAAPVRFNLSHAHELAIYGIMRADEVGIDIECCHPLDGALDIATRFFSPREVQMLRELPPDQFLAGFFRLWTLKEAYLKATGCGITESLASIEFSFLPGQPLKILPLAADPVRAVPWFLETLVPAAGYVGAVVAERPPTQIRCWRWVPG